MKNVVNIARERVLELAATGESDSWMFQEALNVLETAIRADAAGNIRRVKADPDQLRPVAPHAKRSTDYANDFEWAAMIAEGTFKG